MSTAEALHRGQESFERQAWGNAYSQLSAADRERPLDPDDLEHVAVAAYLSGRDAASEELWARAHHESLRLAERAHSVVAGGLRPMGKVTG
ncbi:MAG: hypothetical protein GEU75_17745 [Dehalococcoidia bacterium]|nr:hypothetical protein [Dehalococcoidia bacterium]